MIRYLLKYSEAKEIIKVEYGGQLTILSINLKNYIL